jgi:dipeptidyl aminopeptidase/acylaminoacyl peptidase
LLGFALLGLLASPSAGEAAPEPVSLRALFANPTFSSPRLSDDGEWLAYVQSAGDEQLVIVRPTLGGEAKPILRVRYAETRLGWIEWKGSDLLLVSGNSRVSRGPAVSRVTRLFSLDRAGGELRWLGKGWGWTQFEDDIVSWAPRDPKRVQLARGGEVHWMDARTGALEEAQESHSPVGRWHADADSNVRAGEGWENERYKLFARAAPSEPLIEVLNYEAIKDDGPTFAGFHADPSKLYVHAPHAGRSALFELDIASRELSGPVFAHAQVDVGGVVRASPSSSRIVAVQYTVDRSALHFLDEAFEREFTALENALGAEFGAPMTVGYESLDGGAKRIVVRASSDSQPPAYYLYDRSAKSLKHLIDSRPELDASALAAVRPVSYPARDGVRIPAYLTLPPGSAGKGLPVIVLPHGGPWARDTIEWNPEVQLFATRGFAVFQMNFRGSTGYGKEHLEGGFREVGQKIQDDITDGVRWLISEGVADSDRIGIYGASHGGYAALFGPIAAPDLYRAAGSYAGVSDQNDQLTYWRRYFGGSRDWLSATWGGGSWSDAKRLKRVSPLARAAELRVPVLLGHGEDDEVVNVEQSRKMAAALRKAGKTVEYLEFEHEIHGFLLEANRIRWYEALISFFEKNLAPRAPGGGPESSPKSEEPR